jgi:xanthine phosphoribosyltransferase
MSDKILSIGWDRFAQDTLELGKQLRALQGNWQALVAITRGGLIPAALIAQTLDIRLIDTLCVQSRDEDKTIQSEPQVIKSLAPLTQSLHPEQLLVIDDLVDTGLTAGIVRQHWPQAYLATVYAKPAGRPFVDRFVQEVAQDIWIHFPWEPTPA